MPYLKYIARAHYPIKTLPYVHIREVYQSLFKVINALYNIYDQETSVLGSSFVLKRKYHKNLMSFENPKTFVCQQKQENNCLVLL